MTPKALRLRAAAASAVTALAISATVLGAGTGTANAVDRVRLADDAQIAPGITYRVPTSRRKVMRAR
ncbi:MULTISPECIES: hypothetical protein [unclassified Streptomyces]|uniref:hypothetical protein n=1 Tax=unclassified Streptomyces TaxID=2593676 RepID=UPI00274074BE|nr:MULTISPECIES: hypothetical protein [unclassified Streptomyces]